MQIKNKIEYSSTVERDLKWLRLELKEQLKDPKVNEFWDKTLGETCKRIKTQETINANH
jgi:hypothetical protein